MLIIIMQDYHDHKLAPNQYQNWAFRLNGPSYHYYGPFILCKEMKGFSYLKNVPSCGHDNCDVWFQTYCVAQVSTKDINSRPFCSSFFYLQVSAPFYLAPLPLLQEHHYGPWVLQVHARPMFQFSMPELFLQFLGANKRLNYFLTMYTFKANKMLDFQS